MNYYLQRVNDKLDTFFATRKEITSDTLKEFEVEMYWGKFGYIGLIEKRRIKDDILDTYLIALRNKKRAELDG